MGTFTNQDCIAVGKHAAEKAVSAMHAAALLSDDPKERFQICTVIMTAMIGVSSVYAEQAIPQLKGQDGFDIATSMLQLIKETARAERGKP